MHLLRLKRGTFTEPLEVPAVEVKPIGHALLKHGPSEEFRVSESNVVIPARPEFTTEWYVFAAPDGGGFEGKPFRYVLLAPQNFVNNPEWSVNDLLHTSGPVQAVILTTGYVPASGVPIEDTHVADHTEGYLRYAA